MSGNREYTLLWEILFIKNIFIRAFTLLFSELPFKGFKLWYLDICIGFANIRGAKRELMNPRKIQATPEELEAVAPKPLHEGYLLWGDGDDRYLFDFRNEEKMDINEFSAFILERLEKNMPEEQIVEEACREWDVDKEVIDNDVREFISELNSAGITFSSFH